MLQCMDQGTDEACNQFSELFTVGASLSIPLVGVEKKGTRELETLCKWLHSKFNPCTHWESNVVLRLMEGEVVNNRSYWKAIKGGDCISVGLHEDEFIQVGGKWLCRKRVIRHLWTKERGDIK